MFSKSISSYFFRPKAPRIAMNAEQWFEKQLQDNGLTNKINREQLQATQPTAKVFFNSSYFPDASAIHRALTKIPAVNVAGDRTGVFQNGLDFPTDPDFFAKIPTGHAELLSPLERLTSAKKIIYSKSAVFASGGYPYTSLQNEYAEPINVGLFSLAGASFENRYLHQRLFILDPHHPRIDTAKFPSLFRNLPTEFADAKNELGPYDVSPSFARIRTDLPYLARTQSGTNYPSFSKKNALILASEAYRRHLLEDTSLLLTSVNEAAKEAGKPALLKAAAVGMGFFAKIDGSYAIDHMLYPYFLHAFRKLLTEQSYPWIAKIEFPTFTELQQNQFETMFDNFPSPVSIVQTSRDVLKFSTEETERYFPCAVNPSDAFAYVGNEWGFGSVEAMIGNDSSLRFDQVPHTNPRLLDSKHHISVKINPDFSAEIAAANMNDLIQRTNRM
ncbi:type IV secretion protein Dot [uncultured Legionella sp.]|uniref:type IV secretion protein Dot n=1 Tax=uncultured Legionella sp. TaxID=210934 RepID=UPI00261D6696|nr:type IV secretion protein Dot [uncultured Legionella sp.]